MGKTVMPRKTAGRKRKAASQTRKVTGERETLLRERTDGPPFWGIDDHQMH